MKISDFLWHVTPLYGAFLCSDALGYSGAATPKQNEAKNVPHDNLVIPFA